VQCPDDLATELDGSLGVSSQTLSLRREGAFYLSRERCGFLSHISEVEKYLESGSSPAGLTPNSLVLDTILSVSGMKATFPRLSWRSSKDLAERWNIER
jgi:hypothetical protein